MKLIRFRNSYPSILIHAGLGNQLFQFAYINYICKKNNLDGYQIYRPINTYKRDRPYELKSLSINNHYYKGDFKFDYNLIKLKLKFSPNKNSSEKEFFYIQKNPFENLSELKISEDKKIYYGYYQNWEMVEFTWSILEKVFSKTLKKFDYLNSRFSPKQYSSLHIRCGDNYLNSINNMGTLSLNYYLKLSKQLNELENLVIVTDNKIWASYIMKKIKLKTKYFIYDQKELNSWESLYVMNNSKNLFAANSSFSWWGGLLCSKNGGITYLPNPYFRNWPNSNFAMKHEIFKSIKSEWLDTRIENLIQQN